MAGYKETVEFDLVVLLCVLIIMPLGVMLINHRGRLSHAGLVFLLASTGWLLVFELWRAHTPTVTAGGLRKALQLQAYDELSLRFLALDELLVTSSSAEASARTLGASVAGPPLMVHLAHSMQGDPFFEKIFEAMAARSCGARVSGDTKCLRFGSADATTAPPDALDMVVTTGGPHVVREFAKHTHRPYRAVMAFRDPQAVLASLVGNETAPNAAYLDSAARSFTQRSASLIRQAHAFASELDQDVAFVRVEDVMNGARRCEALGRWFRQEGTLLDHFVDSCEDAVTAEEATREARFAARRPQLERLVTASRPLRRSLGYA